MSDPTITCPKCHSHVPLTESLLAPLMSATRQEYERKIAAKDQDIAGREAALRDGRAALEKAKADLDRQVFETIQSERKRIAAEEAEKARRLVSADIEQRNRELADLQALLAARDEKLAEAQQAQAELIRKQRE